MTPQFNCSATSAADLQLHLNEDLKIVSKWMETNKLTLTVSKTKLMVIGGKQRLSRLINYPISTTQTWFNATDC
jgi:hypothetical protein